MTEERTGVITMKGNPLTLVGPALKPGDPAPDFEAVDSGLQPVSLASSKGKVRIFSVVPSLDTPVCSTQTKKFNQQAKDLPDDIEVITVSCDLPFAQKRFCGAEGVELPVISDHRDVSFGTHWGVLVKELRILGRAIFVVDKNDTVRYVQIVPEIAEEPDYEKALAAAREAAA